MDCQQAAEQDDLDRVKGLCITDHDRLEAFHKALSKGSARVSAYFLAHLPRAALNESRHPLTFLLPQKLCTKYMCTGWAEKYCPGVDARWEQEPVWENFKDGERCCCSFGLGFVKEESWNRQQRLLKHDTHDVSLLVAAAAGGNETFLQRLWNATAVHADCPAALAAAVSYNQTDALMFLLDNCYTSNRNLAYQGVPLVTWAAGLGFAGVVKALLKKNASTQTNSEQYDWKLFQSYTPLAAAIRFDVEGDSLPVVNELLHRSDDRKKLLKALSRGEPPIFIAVVYGKEDLAKIMLRARADPDQATYTGERPLHKAAWLNSCGLTEVLCKHGANVDVTNPHGSTPAMIAAYRGHPEVLSILTKKCKAGLSGRDLWGNTAAHLAAKGDPKLSGKRYLQVIDMVRQGCSWCFQQRNDRGRSPLGTAVFHRRAGHVKYLVSGPFQDRMNAVYQDPVEALYWAMIPDPEICTILLEHVPSNTNVERLSNAVHKAASEGANDCLQQLHERKAYLDSSQNGWTPLCRAAETAQTTILLYLLNQSVGWGKCSGESPLDLAASSQTWWKKDKKDWEKAKNATRLLAEYVQAAAAESLDSLLAGRPGSLNSTCSIGKLHWTGLHWAVMMRNSSMLRHFVSYDNAARLKDSKGRTALSMAAALGLEDHVEILASQSDPNSKDEGGMTPIMWAARHGHANVCKRLKEMTQFQPLQKDSEGNCLMHWAASSGNQEVVDLFRHRLPFNGSKITNHRGETVLFNAVRGRNPYLVEHMIQMGYNANAINAFMQTPLFVALRLCRLEVWDKLKDSTDLHRKDYLGYRIDEMPEFNSSLCLKKTGAEHYLNLQASVTSTTFTEKLESIKADNTFHKYILWTVLLSLLVTCMAKLWSQWRATQRPGTELGLVVSAMDASASESLETTESMETSTSTEGCTGSGCARCGQNVVQVSFRAAQIQTAAKHLDQTLQWKLYARRCMDVVASVVFPTIMFRVLGWVHVLVLCVATSIILPACFKQPGFAVREIVERPAKLFGVRDVWAQLRTVYLLLALLWCAAQSGGIWHETHRYLWDRHVYPMSDLKEISRGEFPVPFPPLNAPLLSASWPAFGIAMAAAAGSILSLMLLKRRHSNSSRPSDHKTYVAVGEDKDPALMRHDMP